MTRYGYVGLGQMGAAMVEHLLASGAEVVVFDIDDAATRRAAELGATVASSAADVASRTEVLSTCVPAAHHIEAVLSGPGGIGEAANPDCTLLIHSTVSPTTMIAANATAARWGTSCFDACVAGGAEAARAGELAVFAGGLCDMPDAARSLLDIYGSKVIDAGPTGAGAALKIGVNVMTYAQQAAARSSFGIVEAAGGSTEALVEAWRHIGQLGKLTEQFLGLLAIAPEHITGGFRDALLGTVSIGQKDLELASELAGADADMGPFLAALTEAMPAVIGTNTEVEGS